MSDKLRILLTTYFIFVCVLISDSYEQRDEGSTCSKLGYPGICEKLKNCPIAVDALKNKGYHDLNRCGFQGTQEIVCCPDLSDRNPIIESTTLDGFIIPNPNSGSSEAPDDGNNVDNKGRLKTKRKCEKMCEKIYLDNNIKPEIGFNIFNGDNALKGQFPHMVALGFENSDEQIEWNCGASLISPRYLLTAAHCFIYSAPKKARMGTIDITDAQSAQDVDVKNYFPHPSYNGNSRHNDIAVVELSNDVQMSKAVYPACLYTEVDDPLGLQISGWGQTASNDSQSKSNILQFAVILPVPVKECNSTLVSKLINTSKTVIETQICATTTSDACLGDSGGPLQIKKREGGYAIVGIVSYGIGCGTKVPGIYTRVARYLDWIEKMVWPNS